MTGSSVNLLTRILITALLLATADAHVQSRASGSILVRSERQEVVIFSPVTDLRSSRRVPSSQPRTAGLRGMAAALALEGRRPQEGHRQRKKIDRMSMHAERHEIDIGIGRVYMGDRLHNGFTLGRAWCRECTNIGIFTMLPVNAYLRSLHKLRSGGILPSMEEPSPSGAIPVPNTLKPMCRWIHDRLRCSAASALVMENLCARPG